MKTLVSVLAFSLLVCVEARVAAQPPDFSQVQIKTTKVAGNFYTLEGQGGTIGVLAGPDGVLMVDAQFAPLGDKIVAAIKQISDGRIRFLVNTHVHGDHTGGNENIGRLGAVILARENLRARLAKPAPSASGQPGTPAPPAALPVVTYDAPVTIHMNGEDVQLIPVPAAHTDGDTMVYFPAANALMTGDFYRSTGYPNIDRANGGTMNGMLAGFDAIIKTGRPDTKIIPGHGATVDKAAVAAHKAMMEGVRDKVAALVRQNKTQEEVVAAKPAAEFDSKVTGATPMTADRFVTQLYQELKSTR
jgi:glyoxylase-like metal-dependent hydrolase (beta-lactamase superfamily II)